MAKSQLKQLKEKLKSNGFTGQTNVKKQKKRVPAATREDKDRVLNSIREEFNPFEIKTTRQKHGDILGRKVQGATGKPGLSKQIGEESRRQTLRKEIERRGKVGGVLDRRFGENDPTLTPEERMLERFTRERLSRSSRPSSLFNLDDDDDKFGTESLTHLGQSLSLDFGENQDFENEDESSAGLKRRATDDDDDDDDEPQHKKSKNEVMKEIIAKSKMYKHERQQAKEEDLEAIEDLDGDLDTIRGLLLQNTSATAQAIANGDEERRDDEYDANVRQMVFERRAQPADRTLTAEEIAEKEAEKLKKLEQERQRRMRGEISDDETETNSKRREPEADDLSDDFVEDDAADFGFGKGLDDYGSDQEGSENEDIDDEETPSDAEDGPESSDSEDAASKKKSVASRKNSVKNGSEKSSKLAFTYSCPSSFTELQSLLNGHSLSDQVVIIERILVLYHPSLHQDNKSKLSKLGPFLLQYLLNLADESGNENDGPNKLIRKLYDLTKSYPESLAEAFRAHLLIVRKRLESALAQPHETDYPLPSDMFLFALIGFVFSTSDHFHLIVTPAMLIMSQHLSQFKAQTLGDVVSKSLIAKLFVKYQALSKRFIPEVTNYINFTLNTIHPTQSTGFPLPYQPDIIKLSIPEVQARNLKISDIMSDTALTAIKTKAEHELILSIFKADLNTLESLLSLWKGYEAYKEIFTPSSQILDALLKYTGQKKISKIYKSVEPIIASTDSLLKRMIKLQSSTRQPLTLQQHKPIPIPTYAPKFEENYSVDKKSYDPDQQRQEISKLRAQVKKERKGAMRELRKDNAFIAREKIMDKRQKDKEYHEMLARLQGSVQTEEGAEKNKYEIEKRLRKGKRK
ncbi:nucleolar protein 14 [Lipomyces japonicus]|uniref:nucleolar protein 14 n=1 Tax=Lipomyces japonicus TaxID=56871 RepID=UPI0034CD6556